MLELFCGIGGVAAALAGRATVVRAVDQSRPALSVYAANHPHPVAADNLARVRPEALAAAEADLWWLSPPCQPFTVRGARADLADPRTVALRAVVAVIAEVRPTWVGLENVPGFQGSAAHGFVRATLAGAGYRVAERILCPTELGVPNRRRRFYLLAGREACPTWGAWTAARQPLAAFLDRDVDDALLVEPALVARYRHALHVVDANDDDAVAACFTAAYGRSPVRSGSYLRVGDRLRRFSPAEVARLLGFPEGWRFPEAMPTERRWALLGNSVSVTAVGEVVGGVPRSLVLGLHVAKPGLEDHGLGEPAALELEGCEFERQDPRDTTVTASFGSTHSPSSPKACTEPETIVHGQSGRKHSETTICTAPSSRSPATMSTGPMLKPSSGTT